MSGDGAVHPAAAVPVPASNLIPAQFQLLGHTVKVVIVPKKRWRRLGIEGHWSPNHNKISILETVPEERIQQVFCHEMCHAILDAMNSPLSQDEAFVDNFAGLLHQAWTTIK